MPLITLGISHHRAPVAVRERAAFADAELGDALVRLRGLPDVGEAAIVSTCNRTEILAMTGEADERGLLDWWRRERQLPDGAVEPYLYVHRDHGSVLHSLRVASGLDSMIVGEPQILGQMKHSYAIATGVRSTGPVLSRLFQHAFAVAKLVRSRTEVGAHPVSVAYAAVQLARRIFTDFSQQTALVVGAGQIAELLARHLRGQGIGRIVVANRSLERAQRLARAVGGYAIALADLPTYLPDADLVVTSTGAREAVIERAAVERALARRRRKPVFMIDLAVPRDIDPEVAKLEDIYLYTVDDLRSVVAGNLKRRGEEARQAEALVEEYAAEFARWMDARGAADTIRAMRDQARAHRDEVLAKAQRLLAGGQPPEEVLKFLADTLSHKLLHAPSAALRDARAVEQALLLSGARKLFGLPEDDRD
ncbi:MAG TPA: glutamyl-tRNA reductase [Candidatus Binatia bacterium]|nr:glutamyl-tRNA reductase [Candidatus Binatia bacterium]